MHLTHIPQSRLSPLVYATEGDVLTVNGVAFAVGALEEGDVLPRAAVAADWLMSAVTRTDGEVRLEVAEPFVVEGWEPEAGEPGAIDWGMVQSTANEAAGGLAAWRAEASLPVVDFALAALQAGLLTADEAKGWVTRQAAPSVVEAAIAPLPEPQRTAAWLEIMGRSSVARAHPFTGLLQSHMGLTDAQVDGLFGGPPSP